MKKNKIDIITGTAKLTEKILSKSRKNGKAAETINAKNIIIATGGSPRNYSGCDHRSKENYHEHRSNVACRTAEIDDHYSAVVQSVLSLPISIISFGTKVTVVEMHVRIYLPVEDKENVKIVETSLKKSGIEILTATKVESVAAE